MANSKLKESSPAQIEARRAARILPHNTEAEQSVLSCIFLSKDVTHHIMEQLVPKDFYNEQHVEIFDAMRDIFAKNIPVDFVTLVEELEKRNLMESVGGMTYISTLTNAVPTAANFKHYVEIVKKHSLMRRLIETAGDIADKAFNPTEAVRDRDGNVLEYVDIDALEYAEKRIFDLGESMTRGALTHISTGLNKAIEQIDLIHRDKEALRGIPTGFKELDLLTNGLQRSDLIIIAARPSVGKTSFGMNLIQNIALHEGKKTEEGGRQPYSCAVFSLEMSARQLAHRMLCSVADVSMADSLAGRLNKDGFKELWIGKKKLSGTSIYIDDSSLVTPTDILSKCRRLKLDKGLDVVMIDYLGLMSSGKRIENRQQDVADMTKGLKIAAKELDVPIILISQVNRESEKGKGRLLQLSDLRESGAIEQDADVVMLMNRKCDKDDMSKSELDRHTLILDIAKHRNGQVKKIKLLWDGDRVSFSDYSEDVYGTSTGAGQDDGEE